MSEPPTDQAWTTGEHGEVEEVAHPTRPLDLRVARVLSARLHPNVDRLLVLDVDAGEPAPRQLVAGIAGVYAPEALVGLHVVIVANLQPAGLRGEISQGMVLDAEAEDERGDEHGLGLLLATDAVPGTRVTAPGLPEPTGQITIDDFRRHELVADDTEVTIDGARVERHRLVTDRGMRGRLR